MWSIIDRAALTTSMRLASFRLQVELSTERRTLLMKKSAFSVLLTLLMCAACGGPESDKAIRTVSAETVGQVEQAIPGGGDCGQAQTWQDGWTEASCLQQLWNVMEADCASVSCGAPDIIHPPGITVTQNGLFDWSCSARWTCHAQ